MDDSSEKNGMKFDSSRVEEETVHYLPPEANDRWASINKFSDNKKEEMQSEKCIKKQTLRIAPRIISHFNLNNPGNILSKSMVKSVRSPLKTKFLSLFNSLLRSNGNMTLTSNSVIKNWVARQREKRNQRRFNNFNPNQIRILGDKSLEPSARKSMRVMYESAFLAVANITERIAKQNLGLSNLKKFIPTIHPEGKAKLSWNILICICILFQFFTITIELFFDSDWHQIDSDLNYFSFQITEISKYLILVDIVMNIFTGYFQNGCVVMESSKIFHNYVKKLMIIDILVLVPIFLDYDSQTSDEVKHQSALYSSKLSIIKLLFVFRLFKLTRTFYYIEKILANNEKIEGVLSLLKLCFKILFTAHLFACMWFFIGDNCLKKGLPSWLDNYFKNKEVKDWRSYYVVSLYWSITTMITVGYGDILPQNSIETGFVITYEIIGCGLFGYSLSNIGSIFEKLFTKDNNLNANLRIINRFMKRKKIDFELQGKVRQYLDFVLREAEVESSEKENELINKLSYSLKKELLLQANGNILMNCPLLHNNFSKKTIERLTEIMIPVDLAPEDCIFEEGSTHNEQLFFLSKGTIDLYLYCNDSGRDSYLKIRRIQEGEVFGERSFITGEVREMSAVSVGYSKIFMLKKQEFEEIIKEDEQDFEQFCLMRDKILLYNDASLSYIKCASCNLGDHNVIACPSLKYLPEKALVIMKYLHRKKQRTKYLKRKTSKSPCALKNASNLLEAKEFLRDDYDLSHYEEELNEIRNYMPEELQIEYPSDISLVNTELPQRLQYLSNDCGRENSRMNSEDINKEEESNEEARKSKLLTQLRGSNLPSPNEKEPAFFNESAYDKLTSLEGCLVISKKGKKASKIIVKDNYKATSAKSFNRLTTLSTTNKSKKNAKEKELTPIFHFDFEKGKNFKCYFPRNNFEEVCFRIRMKQGCSFSPFDSRKRIQSPNGDIANQQNEGRLLRKQRRFKTVALLQNN